ncbi:MAG: hypothetical protein ABTQ73_06675 [Caldilineales bacterium]
MRIVTVVLRWSLYLALLVGSVAACTFRPQPQRPQSEAATTTAQLEPTVSPTPTATALPPAVLQAGALPAGQVIFSVQRAGEAGAGLWRLNADGLQLLRSDVVASAWDCADTAMPSCVTVASDAGLYAFDPISRSVQLLDVLDGWTLPPVAVAEPPMLTEPAESQPAEPVTLTMSAESMPAEPVTLTMSADSPSFEPLTFTGPAESLLTEPLTLTVPFAVLPSPTLALSADGKSLAVAAFSQLRLYALAEPALLAALPAPNPTEMAWSPDGQWLAVIADDRGRRAVWLWGDAAGQFTSLAQMEAAAHLAWSPDSSQLAFDARMTAATPSNQGDQSDIFLWQRDSNEIRNVTELFLTNGWTDPAYQIAAWLPQWEPDGMALRYLRGLPADPTTYAWARQTLSGNRFISILPLAVEPGAGFYPQQPVTGLWLRRLPRDGRDLLQQSLDGNSWQDVGGTFAEIRSVAWQPATAAAKAASPRLLIADRQSLLLLDPVSNALSGLAVTCAACEISHAVWLP